MENSFGEKSKLESKIAIPLSIVKNIIKYCEDKAIYDKLGQYGDFYYKLKQIDKLKKDYTNPSTDFNYIPEIEIEDNKMIIQ